MSEVPLWKGKGENQRLAKYIQMRRENKTWSSCPSIIKESDDKICPSSGNPISGVDLQERWQEMIYGLRGRDVYFDLIEGSTARKQAHLKSELNYNWERAMRSEHSSPKSREKERRERGSSSLGDKLRKYLKKNQQNSKHCDFTIPEIIITEAPPDIRKRNIFDAEGSQC
ncbi:hypothetical protein OS493_003509 [Desmophyllum pertusum]|uniref:Uncharacterized protein n=1 Tax=Desmophyllum pertusum TaxID=174260 RepID=A0A9X0A5P1_9CNID|nr:hypothetical protein OS493_003509 [Desmophyllum pertusum]